MFKVECYTSSKLNERPVAFVLSNSRYKVEEIIDRWYGEGSRYFKIKADDDRSEERRVGKECRSRWSPYH